MRRRRTSSPARAGPDELLPLAFDLYARGRLDDGELVRVIGSQPPADLRAFFEAEHGRTAADVETFLAHGGPLHGVDVLDQAFIAIAGAGVDIADRVRDSNHPARAAARALETVIGAVVTKKLGALTRRAAASLLSIIATRTSATLIGACCVLDPRLIARTAFSRDAVTTGLLRFQWPVRLPRQEVARLLATPHVRGDLALSVAVAGLFSGSRLKLLVSALGEDAIIASLLASDRGWDEICRLPADSTALELAWLAWLARLERQAPVRYVSLVATSLLALPGKRLEQHIDIIPRKHREAAFLAVVAREIAVDDPRIPAICRPLASRLDRTALISIFTALLADATSRGPQIALLLARAIDAKQLGAVGRALADDSAVRFIALLDGPDPLPRDRELALAAAFAERSHTIVSAWGKTIGALPVREVRASSPAVRAQRALDEREQDTIATCADGSSRAGPCGARTCSSAR